MIRTTCRSLTHALLVAAFICGALLPSCKDRAAPPAPGATSTASRAAAVPATLFDQAFHFACSPLKKVGCSGVLPVRPEPSPTSPPGPAGGVSGGESEAAILQTGQDAFRLRVATLQAAQRSVRIQALIFRADEAGLTIAELLKKKKKAGLDVRVIVDAASNMDWQTQWMYFDLKQYGIEVEGYEALYMHFMSGEVKLDDPLRANKRFHDKLWIIDAEDRQRAVAIVGGLNIANEYFRVDDTPINRWRDQDVALKGPIVNDVVAVFDRNFEFFKSLKHQRPGLLNSDNLWKLSRATVTKIAKIKVPHWRKKRIVEAIGHILERPAELDYLPVTARFLQSRPRLKETYIRQAYDDLIDRAQKEVFIVNAYFIPSRSLTKKLKDAARRGVRVVIVTNSPATNDISQVALVSRYTYLDLLAVNDDKSVKAHRGSNANHGSRAGIEIYEWEGPPHKEGTLHAKFAVVDGREAIVGSFNLDPRSERLNSETAVALRDSELVGRLQRAVTQDILPKSQRIDQEQAARFRKPAGVKKQFKLLFSLPLKKWL